MNVLNIVCIDPTHKSASSLLPNPTCIPTENAETLTNQHPLYAKYHRDARNDQAAKASDGTLVPARKVAGPKSHHPGNAKAAIQRGIEGIKQWRVKTNPNTFPPKPPPPPQPKLTKRPASTSPNAEERVVMRSGPQAHHEVFKVAPAPHYQSGGTRSSGSDHISRGRNPNDSD